MQKLFKIPFVFLFIGALMGLFLRYMMMASVPGVTFSYLLHGHSHVMFLGWIFNVLFLAFVTEFTDERRFKTIFWAIQILVTGMLISFPLQGYGFFSILFSTLHTFAAFVFIFLFFKSIKGQSSLALSLTKAALLFFVLASFGPFYLGYLQANDLEKLNVYRFSIYFYLHFQYNGFFYFGILSLFIKLIESNLTSLEMKHARRGCYFQVVACLPAYFLSILWSNPPFVFNIIGVSAAILQLIGFGLFFRATRNHLGKLQPTVRILVNVAGLFLLLKLLLQIISASPQMAILANEFRSIVIAYLHLVLIGIISLFLFAWFIEKRILNRHNFWATVALLFGFVCSELVLVYLPWNNSFVSINPAVLNQLLFAFSVLIVGGIGSMITSLFRPL